MSLVDELKEADLELSKARSYVQRTVATHKIDGIFQRIRELEADAELGSLVRRMPPGTTLGPAKEIDKFWIVDMKRGHGDLLSGSTPEEALKEALWEE